MKHKNVTRTIGAIINEMNCARPWYEVMGIDLPGMDEAETALEAGVDDQAALDAMAKIEDDWLKIHADDEIEVGWPEHVLCPKFNGDAYYYHSY